MVNQCLWLFIVMVCSTHTNRIGPHWKTDILVEKHGRFVHRVGTSKFYLYTFCHWYSLRWLKATFKQLGISNHGTEHVIHGLNLLHATWIQINVEAILWFGDTVKVTMVHWALKCWFDITKTPSWDYWRKEDPDGCERRKEDKGVQEQSELHHHEYSITCYWYGIW